MITKDIKISKLLEQYPGSLNILLKASPHFNKLQNKMLRKALAGRVTIEQAASIAGIDLNKLLAELNNTTENNNYAVSSISESDNEINKEKPEYLKSINAEKISSLDVRPILDSGKDPLQSILLKIKELKKDEVLLIINSFEPIPLYSVLGKKGYSHWTEKEIDCFKVFFYKEKNELEAYTTFLNSSFAKIDESEFENIIELDVSELQPPEPMMKILENLYRVDERTVMLVHHHREPHLLYPKLEERGYEAFCNKLGEDRYKILIAKKKV